MRLLLILCLTALSLTACKDSGAEDVKISVVKLEAGEFSQVLYIPKKDFYNLTPYSGSKESVLLHFMYPNMTPLLESSYDIWKRGEQYKKVRILISQTPKFLTISEWTKFKLKQFKTSRLVGEEYGLVHYTQPENGIQDHDDVWAEKNIGSNGSVITCSDKITKASVPQCAHFLRPNNLSVRFSYDKVHLKNWRLIRDDVVTLLESYKSPETAKTYFKKRYKLAKEKLSQ